MNTQDRPQAGVDLLRAAILQAVADSRSSLSGTDIVKKFATSGWTMPPSVKDVRDAVRWLEARGLLEWRRAPDRAAKELHLSDAGHEAVRETTEHDHDRGTDPC